MEINLDDWYRPEIDRKKLIRIFQTYNRNLDFDYENHSPKFEFALMMVKKFCNC